MKSFRQIINEEIDEVRQQRIRKESEEKLQTTLEKHYKDAGSRGGIYDYTAESYPINSHLWKGHKNHFDVKKENNPDIEAKVKNLDATLASYKTPQAMTVWSKSLHDPRDLKDKNNVVHHPAYISSTIKKSVVDNDYEKRNVVHKDGVSHHHIYKIEVPEGHPGVFVPDNSTIDKRAKEFILPRGTNLLHKGTDTLEYNDKIHYHTHNLEVIP